MKQIIQSVFLKEDRLFIIDQRALPSEEKIIELHTEQEVFDAIQTLAVRGAPAIGITAAYGVFIAATRLSESKHSHPELKKVVSYLKKSRPTAYNLFYALDRMQSVLDQNPRDLLSALKNEALSIHREDLEKSDQIASFGIQILKPNARVLTHCNTGGLATGGNGTALGVVFHAYKKGRLKKVFVDETRPLLQGARLTAWELKKTGIPYEIITDSMAGIVLKQKKVDAVIVGADRIALNGDFANKIGTYSLAVLCHYHGIPFYAAAPLTTFDFEISDGSQIPIEERSPQELIRFQGVQSAPLKSPAYNPAFDVTPHHLVTGIICEKGILYPPYTESIGSIQKFSISPIKDH